MPCTTFSPYLWRGGAEGEQEGQRPEMFAACITPPPGQHPLAPLEAIVVGEHGPAGRVRWALVQHQRGRDGRKMRCSRGLGEWRRGLTGGGRGGQEVEQRRRRQQQGGLHKPPSLQHHAKGRCQR